MADEPIWITFEARGEPGHQRGYGTRVHPSREAAHAYAEAHGLIVGSTRCWPPNQLNPRREQSANA